MKVIKAISQRIPVTCYLSAGIGMCLLWPVAFSAVAQDYIPATNAFNSPGCSADELEGVDIGITTVPAHSERIPSGRPSSWTPLNHPTCSLPRYWRASFFPHLTMKLLRVRRQPKLPKRISPGPISHTTGHLKYFPIRIINTCSRRGSPSREKHFRNLTLMFLTICLPAFARAKAGP